MTYLKVWCEYDYGQDELIFKSEKKAKAWLEAAITEIDGIDWIEAEFGSIEQFFGDTGLAGFTIVTLIKDDK